MEQYSNVVQDLEGNVVPEAVVRVLLSDGGANAVIFDASGAQAANPAPCDDDGYFAFQAGNGKYFLQVEVANKVYKKLGPITLYDPANDLKLARIFDAEDFPSIQAGLDALGTYGGYCLLRLNRVHYITEGLKYPSNTGLTGLAPVRFPYPNSSPKVALITRFTNPMQWAIEPKTTDNGSTIPYNSVLDGMGLPTGPTFNCVTKDLLILHEGVAPYGTIRMHGCPGAIVRDVGVVGSGIGVLMNKCFGGEMAGVHTITLYHGVIGWGEFNANKADVYCTQLDPKPQSIPEAYRFAGLTKLAGNYTTTLGLSTELHASTPCGAVFGSDGSTSASNELGVTTEYWPTHVFMYNMRAAFFSRLYMEGDAGSTKLGIVAANSSFNVAATTANLGAGATFIDPGISMVGKINLDGVLNYSTFKTGARLVNTSRLTIGSVSRAGALHTVPEPNVSFPDDPGAWIEPTLINGWTNTGSGVQRVGYRINPKSSCVENRGGAIGGVEGQAAYVLPPGYRKLARDFYISPITGGASPSGLVIVLATGDVIPATTGMSANGLSFSQVSYAQE